jgi:hypothetical protein
MKRAILQVADQGPTESLVLMLRAVGYTCLLPSARLRSELRSVCGRAGLVLDVDSLVRGMGYEVPRMGGAAIPEADEIRPGDVYADVKAHRVYDSVVGRWPHLRDRVLWYRINGCSPEHVIKPDGEDCGDEVNPPCPVLTPNMWYKRPGPWQDRSYAVYPPFYRADEYYPVHGRTASGPPVCLVHGALGWGYGRLFDGFRAMGVRILGAGSPDGLVSHAKIPATLAGALCMVHLKSSDSPGYAIYECLAAGCPLVCTRRLIWRSALEELLVPGETCLVFDRETHEGLTDADVASCTAEVRDHLERLRDPAENARIGQAGRERLRATTWSEGRAEDVESLRAFMARHFGE